MYCMVTIPDVVARGAPFPITDSELDLERETIKYQLSDLSCFSVPLDNPYWTMRASAPQAPAPPMHGAPAPVDPVGSDPGWGSRDEPLDIPGIEVDVTRSGFGMGGLALLALGLLALSKKKRRR